MFIGKMVTEAIPSRVFALYQLVASLSEPQDRETLRTYMEPVALRSSTDSDKNKTSYFPAIFVTASNELQLIEERENTVVLTNPSNKLRNMADFCAYTVGRIEIFKDGHFNQFSQRVLGMNAEIYRYKSLTDNEFLAKIRQNPELGDLTDPEARGWRFWAEFLGLGLTVGNDNMEFLPNAYKYIREVLQIQEKNGEIQKGAEIDINNFVDGLRAYGSFLFDDEAMNTRTMNMAVSNGLRMLNDRNELKLVFKNDIATNWNLYPNAIHGFGNQVSSVIYKGMKR